MSLLIPNINSDNQPSARYGHTSVFYRDYVLVYGGDEATDDEYIWLYNVDTSQWKNHRTTGKLSFHEGIFYKFRF